MASNNRRELISAVVRELQAAGVALEDIPSSSVIAQILRENDWNATVTVNDLLRDGEFNITNATFHPIVTQGPNIAATHVPTGLSYKGIPGVNQIPHPSEPRPFSGKAVAGAFQQPDSKKLNAEDQHKLSKIKRAREHPIRGFKDFSRMSKKDLSSWLQKHYKGNDAAEEAAEEEIAEARAEDGPQEAILDPSRARDAHYGRGNKAPNQPGM